jgi:hypothetical protein
VTGVTGPLTRRELLGRAARWTVPTVVTLTLGVRVARAQASCPPCTRRTGGKCKACSVSQMLNCQCEPCLGPPYCTGSPAPPSGSSSGGAGFRAFPTAPRPGQGGPTVNFDPRRRLYEPPAGRSVYDRLSEPLFRDPFDARESLRSPFRDRLREPSLYERLRGDTLSTGRRP